MIDRSLFGQEHVRRYRETDGEVGYLWNGAPTLLLTTTGRRTGEPTTTPLIFGRDGDDFVLVASQGGAPEHPGWYRNLSKQPEVELQVGLSARNMSRHDSCRRNSGGSHASLYDRSHRRLRDRRARFCERNPASACTAPPPS